MSDSRARGRAPKITFAQNRRTRGTWQTALPSRFIDELPVEHVEVAEEKALRGYGPSRFDTPRICSRAASTRRLAGSGRNVTGRAVAHRNPPSREPITIDGTLVAASTAEGAGLEIGMRVFHQKFGYGRVAHVDGNKLTVDFDKAGQKKVVDTFVERV
jgi:DNA helicase-2/ATP-dependent DNA helicase PcrA